jgi:hypothetical protein
MSNRHGDDTQRRRGRNIDEARGARPARVLRDVFDVEARNTPILKPENVSDRFIF